MILACLTLVSALICTLSQPASLNLNKPTRSQQQRHPIREGFVGQGGHLVASTIGLRRNEQIIYGQSQNQDRNILAATETITDLAPLEQKGSHKLLVARRLLVSTAGATIGNAIAVSINKQQPVDAPASETPAIPTIATSNPSNGTAAVVDINSFFADLPAFQPKHGGYQPNYKQAASKPLPNPTAALPTQTIQLGDTTSNRKISVMLVSPTAPPQTLSTSTANNDFTSAINLIVVNCEVYDRNGQCKLCSTKYILKNGQCMDVSNKPTQMCSYHDGYLYDSSGKCALIDPNCILATLDGFCSMCAAYYQLSNGVCFTRDLSACSHYDQGFCQGCIQNFSLNDRGQCVGYNKNCLTYNSSGDCLTCGKSSRLVNGRCEPIKIGDLCLVKKNDVCTRCMPYAALNENKTCVYNDSNCKRVDDMGFCSFCKSGFLLLDRQCVQVRPMLFRNWDANCFAWSDTLCTECNPGYWLTDDSFCQFIDKCSVTNATTGQCTACFDGSLLLKGKCLKDPNFIVNCKTYNPDKTKCVECQTTFIVDLNGGCAGSR